jgi:hypothetical protein
MKFKNYFRIKPIFYLEGPSILAPWGCLLNGKLQKMPYNVCKNLKNQQFDNPFGVFFYLQNFKTLGKFVILFFFFIC